jgi:hypothetical protein
MLDVDFIGIFIDRTPAAIALYVVCLTGERRLI